MSASYLFGLLGISCCQNELCDPFGCDAAQLPDLNAAEMPCADQVIDAVAADVQDLSSLVDR
jgi:hypothetical protein